MSKVYRGSKRGYQQQKSAFVQKQSREEMLIDRQEFLNLIGSATDSVDIYSKAFLAGKPKPVMETLNNGMNLQIMFVKEGVKEKMKTGKDWDKETLRLGRDLADRYCETVARRKAEAEAGRNLNHRLQGTFKRMDTFADAIRTALEDPSKVAQPRTSKYRGPAGSELDRMLQEESRRTGKPVETGFSSMLHANHKHDAMVEDVHKNPERYDQRHSELRKNQRSKRKKKAMDPSYIPSSTFNLDIAEEDLDDDGYGDDDPMHDSVQKPGGAPDVDMRMDVRDIPSSGKQKRWW